MLEAIANEAGVSLDVGKNRVTGNYGKSGKSDEELKRLRDRLGAFKNARQTYQKYRQIMGISAAMEETERLFPHCYPGHFGFIAWMKDYQKESEDYKQYCMTHYPHYSMPDYYESAYRGQVFLDLDKIVH